MADEKQPKKKGRKGLWITLIVVVFAIIGLASMNKENKNANTNSTAQANVTAKNANTQQVTLAEHKVIPKDTHGTTKIVYAIVNPNITRAEVIAINDSLISQYSSGLTHLTIEYFDDETVSGDYFSKITDLLSQDKTTEADNLAKHYLATYTMNTVSGLNQLEYKENGELVSIKNY
ncbi:MAG: hypothetical protein WC497_00340 [Patescibacteria group bacterium]